MGHPRHADVALHKVASPTPPAQGSGLATGFGQHGLATIYTSDGVSSLCQRQSMAARATGQVHNGVHWCLGVGGEDLLQEVALGFVVFVLLEGVVVVGMAFKHAHTQVVLLIQPS